MAQELSSRSAFTLSVVIAGAPGAATRTGRPNFPRRSFAPLTEPRCRINRWPSSFISTLSPALRFNAFRSGAGITSCPLVESFELLMALILTRLTFMAKGSSLTPREGETFPLFRVGSRPDRWDWAHLYNNVLRSCVLITLAWHSMPEARNPAGKRPRSRCIFVEREL